MKSLILLSNVSKMKTMKIWRNIFVMCAAVLSLASCSSDDEEFQTNQLAGTWLRVYDEGVVAEGARCPLHKWRL